MFTGLRADSQKLFSVTPLFRIQHGLALGSQALSPYQLMAVYGTSAVYLQAGLSNDGSLTAWGNYRWTPKFISKTQASLQPGESQALIQFDNDYTGDDFSASIKAMNPSVLQGSLTGIFIGSYLQSLTPSLALGLEGIWQRQAPTTRPETVISYAGRYKGSDWVASAQVSPQGTIGASYWKKLTEKVEAGADLQLQFAPGPGGAGGMFGGLRREGTATVGAKYDFVASTFRAQVDSSGKVAAYLEKRVTPVVGLTFAGEIDQVKQQTKIGLAVSIESAPEELMTGAIQPSESIAPPI